MTTDIDAIIAEATQIAPEQPAASNEAEIPQETEVTQEIQQETEADIAKKPDSELTPEQLVKREKNRDSHLNSKLAAMRRANRELEARLAQVNQPKPQEVKPSTKPNPNDPFYKDKTWEQYNEDLTDWKLDQKLTENTKKTQETQQQQEYVKWVDDRSQKIDTRLIELREFIPDIDDIVEEVGPLIASLSPEQARIALEAEDANLALATLYKEGKLQEVAKLSPSQLAAALAKAEIRGQKYLTEPKPVTNAPRPMNAAKGNTTGGKSLEKQSVDELMSSYGFR